MDIELLSLTVLFSVNTLIVGGIFVFLFVCYKWDKSITYDSALAERMEERY